MRTWLSPVAIVVTLAIGAACADSDLATGPVPTGSWGGVGIALIVSDVGGDLEFDCAFGETPERLVLGRDGRFEARGTFTAEHGGPLREDEVLESEPALYSGEVEGDRMTLTIRLLEGDTTIGPFALERDIAPILRKCL